VDGETERAPYDLGGNLVTSAREHTRTTAEPHDGPERYAVRVKASSATLPKALDDKLVLVARRLRKPRRTVLREAIEEYAARHAPDAITEAMNRVADLIDTRPDPAIASATRRLLKRSEW
jgi:predicted transcriptional regulator